jgi:hypothetical protein
MERSNRCDPERNSNSRPAACQASKNPLAEANPLRREGMDTSFVSLLPRRRVLQRHMEALDEEGGTREPTNAVQLSSRTSVPYVERLCGDSGGRHSGRWMAHVVLFPDGVKPATPTRTASSVRTAGVMDSDSTPLRREGAWTRNARRDPCEPAIATARVGCECGTHQRPPRLGTVMTWGSWDALLETVDVPRSANRDDGNRKPRPAMQSEGPARSHRIVKAAVGGEGMPVAYCKLRYRSKPNLC